MTRVYDDFLDLCRDTKIKSFHEGWYAFEETVFYGEKGGMLSDEGTINGKQVLELKWENGILWHRVDGELQDPIHMEVDRTTRWNNTAIQSAYHLLDGFYERLGLRIVAIGVHPGNQWYEVDTKELPEGHLEEVQRFMNECILDNIPLNISYVKGSEYPDPRYQIHDEVRILRFGEINTQPCGTPHVNGTEDILAFTVLSSERSGRGTKIYTAVGPMVSTRLNQYHRLLHQMALASTVSIAELPEKLTRLIADNKMLKKENEELLRDLYGYRAEELLQTEKSVLVYPAKDAGELRAISQALLEKSDRELLIAAEIDQNLHFYVISPTGKARERIEALKARLIFSGGGSSRMGSGKAGLSMKEFCEIMADWR